MCQFRTQEMDQLFRGLDDRLRVSGMLADSIMMGIVNSAMENAYKNSCTKEGILVRLNEKSRFCELAIMQLEWCLKFLQEQTEDNNIFESTCDREILFSDLLVTRDRIYNRLKETEVMIAEKDRELSERMEIEYNLRLALEVKDEDITSLSTALGLEREKRKKSKKSMEKIGVHGFGEVKSCVDEQLRKIKGKLEDGQHNLKSLMRRISSRSLDLDKLISDFDLDGEEASVSSSKDTNSKLMLQGVQSLNWEIEFKEMAMDMDILKEKTDYSFKMMASSVSLFKTVLDEQQWVWNAEREAINIIIRGFLREVQYKFDLDLGVPIEGVSSMPLDTNLAAFMDDIASLHEELGKLVPEMDMVKLDEVDSSKRNEGCLGNYDVSGASRRDSNGASDGDEKASSMFGQVDHTEELCEESPSCRSVAQKIRSHEFIIRKKAKEIDGLKGERSKGKGYSSLRSERSLDSFKDAIARVNSSVECIIKERPKFVMHCDDLKWKVGRGKNPLQKTLSGTLLGEEEPQVVQSMRDIIEQSSSGSCCNLIYTELSEEIKQLSGEKEDLDIKSIMLEETYSIIFTGLLRGLDVEYIDCNIDTQISEGIYRDILREVIKEWSDNIESYITDIVFMEETYHHVLSDVVKDISCALNLIAGNSSDEDMPLHDILSQSSQVSRSPDAKQEPDASLNHLSVRDCLELDSKSVLLGPHIHIILNQGELEKSNDQGDAFSSVNGSSGNVFHQLTSSNIPLKDVTSSTALPPDDEVVPDYQVTLVIDSVEDAKISRCLPTRLENRQLNNFQLIMTPLTEFSEKINDFEVIACGKIRANMTRYYLFLIISR